jgi:hypothetical protein
MQKDFKNAIIQKQIKSAANFDYAVFKAQKGEVNK